MNLPVSPCSIAFERYQNLARWRNLWTILLFVFGATVIVFLVGTIFLFIRQDWVVGVVSTLGTIVNGFGVSWVVARRNEAVVEESAAYEDVKVVCGSGGGGGGGTGLEMAGGPREGSPERPTILHDLEAVRRSHRVFGRF